MQGNRALLIAVLLAAWPAAAQVPGVKNFAQVGPNLYRGGQPSAEGFRSLSAFGIRTVVDLRRANESRNEERQAVEALGMRYVQVPFPASSAPPAERVDEVLRLLAPASLSGGPVFVHCMRGKDRTGVAIAAYRIAHDGWDNERALAEARSYGLSRVFRGMRKFILEFRPSPVAVSTAR